MDTVTRRAELDKFYNELATLELYIGGKRRLGECRPSTGWPRLGVYFFFEAGESRENGDPRVVRVGTHALGPSRSTLWGRLSQHKGNVGGNNPGGGNHRGSIFRKHVGTALLATGDWPEAVRASWGVGSTANRSVRAAEWALERAVSDYISNMPLLWLEVDDPPSAQSDRGVIEAGSIALLSNFDRAPLDPPSQNWLGRLASSDFVRHSGLWNVDHVRAAPGVDFLEVLHRRIILLQPSKSQEV